MRKHLMSLHFHPRPKLSAVFSNAPNGQRSRVNLKLKSYTVKLHLTESIKAGDEKAKFMMTGLPVENNFILSLKNDSHLQLPSNIIFEGFLLSNDENCVLLDRNLELPVCSETNCDKVTLLAKVVRIP